MHFLIFLFHICIVIYVIFRIINIILLLKQIWQGMYNFHINLRKNSICQCHHIIHIWLLRHWMNNIVCNDLATLYFTKELSYDQLIALYQRWTDSIWPTLLNLTIGSSWSNEKEEGGDFTVSEFLGVCNKENCTGKCLAHGWE